MAEFRFTEAGKEKRCPHCKEFKLYTETFFAPMSCKLYKQLRAECRDCQKQYRATYRQENGK